MKRFYEHNVSITDCIFTRFKVLAITIIVNLYQNIHVIKYQNVSSNCFYDSASKHIFESLYTSTAVCKLIWRILSTNVYLFEPKGVISVDCSKAVPSFLLLVFVSFFVSCVLVFSYCQCTTLSCSCSGNCPLWFMIYICSLMFNHDFACQSFQRYNYVL